MFDFHLAVAPFSPQKDAKVSGRKAQDEKLSKKF